MRRRFVTLDVFTSRRFAGNPLAVVLEAEGLSGDAMQTIAREFNLSETVFVLPPENAAHRAKLRIFTPGAELPFAGHPTVGTAVLLGQIDGKAGAQDFVLEEGVGPVRCRVEPVDADSGRASFELPRLPEHRGEAGDAVDIAAALTLELDDLGCEDFEPGKWTAGVPFAMISVRGLDAIGRSRPNLAVWDTAFGTPRPTGPFLFCRETVEAGHAFHARMFAPHMGITEDPATGSAAAAFAGLHRAAREFCRRLTRIHHRARLRNGTAKPDSACADHPARCAGRRHDRRRRGRRQRRHDRGLRP